MDEKMKDAIVSSLKTEFDGMAEGIQKGLSEKIDKHIATLGLDEQIADQVKATYMASRSADKSISGLAEDKHKELNKELKGKLKSAKSGSESMKSYSLLASEGPSGGFLLPEETRAGIERIAKVNGVMMNLADVYNTGAQTVKGHYYTKDSLLGEYDGYEGAPSANTSLQDEIKRYVNKTEKWNLLLAVPEALIEDVQFDMTSWLIALVAEGMSARLDKEVLSGSTTANPSPFKGVFTDSYFSEYQMATGKTTVGAFDPEVAELVRAQVEDETDNNGVFVMHPEVIATIITQRVDQGGGAGTGQLLFDQSQAGYMYLDLINRDSLRPRAFLGAGARPVYTSRYAPSPLTGTTTNKNFGVYGDFKKAIEIAMNGEMEVRETRDGTVNGVNTFTQGAVGFRFSSRHGIARKNPNAIVRIKTASS